jgi:alpha-glucosidase (family GH31 glycosyl hydrolase)
MKTARRVAGLFCGISLLFFVFSLPSAEGRGIQREKFVSGDRYLVVEVLDDDLIHFELSESRTGPDPMTGIYTTPMVLKKDYPGPAEFRREGNSITTAGARVTVDPTSLCADVYDRRRGKDLLRACGEGMNRPDKTLVIIPKGMRNVYGLGNFFYDTSVDGDWIGREWRATGYGNVRRPFDGAAPSESQFPVFYALGDGLDSFGFFFDHPYRLSWDFRNQGRWSADTWGDQFRWYVLLGPDLKSLRRDFMELTGKPPIPPRSLFGLWVSKFGYVNWDDIRIDLDSLRSNRFPIDGFALDLQWFGGTFNDATNARMGSLWFDSRNFFMPEEGIKRLRKELGVSLMLVEEEYVDERLPEHRMMMPPEAPDCYLARTKEEGCSPVRFGSDVQPLWWGRGGMIDWTSDAAGKLWHDRKRMNLGMMGITVHWLDLGEPEMYDDQAWYHGVEPGKRRHIDIHNLYNFKWTESIHLGYRDPKNREMLRKGLGLTAPPRYFSMSRAGAPGVQRLGGGMWSGDIGRNMGSLRAHLNTQMHMSLAGIDYYNSDVGGFIGTHGFGIEPEHTDAELYTQWFADSALGEIPLRPHGWSYSGEIPTFGPDRQGHRESNRANLLQRYELFPYVYSLAHRAWKSGDPIFPPLVYHYQSDLGARRLAGIKMIGDSLLYGAVVGFARTEQGVYLPRGRWAHYNTGEWFDSNGEETREIPLYLDREARRVPGETPAETSTAKTYYLDTGASVALSVPLFARTGAVIPVMAVDERTMNISGKRMDGPPRPEVRVKVFSGAGSDSFILFEDDGETLAYERGEVRETPVTRRRVETAETVAIGPSTGSYRGASAARVNLVHLVTDDEEATGVSLNGTPLPQCSTETELEKGEKGCWVNARRNIVLARSAEMAAGAKAEFRFELAPVPPRTSVNFVCDSATTQPGEGVYVLGNIPELGEWDPKRAIRLVDIRYPRWTGRVGNLPPKTSIEWKCIKRDDIGGGINQVEAGTNHAVTTPGSGYAGTTRGTLKGGEIRAGSPPPR